MDLSYSLARRNGWTVVSVTGEIDVYSAATLREPLNALIDIAGNSVLLDLQAVDFMDSMGLRVIVGAHKRAEATRSQFALLSTRPQIRNLLHITGLDEVIPMLSEIPQAFVRDEHLARSS
jgi:anti-sigma B factor antagonist